jgi:hypothetical protein
MLQLPEQDRRLASMRVEASSFAQFTARRSAAATDFQ